MARQERAAWLVPWIAVAIALMALLVSLWTGYLNARSVAIQRLANNPEILLLSADRGSWGGEFSYRSTDPSLFCEVGIRLQNIGGASAFVVEVEATLSLLDEDLRVSTVGGASTQFARDDDFSSPYFRTMGLVLLNSQYLVYGLGDVRGNDAAQVPLPVEVPEHSPRDFLVRTFFEPELPYSVFDDPLAKMYGLIDLSEYEPVWSSVEFRFGDGQVVRSPELPCRLVRKAALQAELSVP